ncbi:MAG: glycosyltransferase [Actinobacteria bacterium]|nr:glycosyltransferase [Actinomycetota bacterium]
MPDKTVQNLIDFSIVIPAYNEEGRIVCTLKETAEVFENFNSSYEIIAVDDGSTDKTRENVEAFISSGASYCRKVRIESYSPNMGKGNALKHGASIARGKYILFLDADLDLHPSIAKELYEIIKTKDADVVIGSKMHRKSVLHYPFLRKLTSYCYYIIIKILFRLSIKDTQTGIKLFKREVLGKCLPKVIVKRYAFDLELLVAVNKKGYSIVEAPVRVDLKRQFGRVGIKDAIRVFFDTMGVFLRLNFKKYYD